jgi:hypothetical protein
MKNKSIMTLGLAGFAVLGTIQTVSAQTLLKAQIPFPFRASQAYLPSGDYTVTVVSNFTSRIFLLRNVAARRSAMVVAAYSINSRGANRPRLVFDCVEGACALSQIWAEGNSGVQAPVPRSPANPEKLIASKTVPLTR